MEPDGDVDVGKEGDVEDNGGEDIGEHDGVEPDVEVIGGWAREEEVQRRV